VANARKHRENLVDSAVRLFRRQGYAGTGLQQILELSGAPKGSLYHYFPGGKEAIGAAAVERAGELVAATLEQLADEHPDADSFLAAYFEQYAEWMEESEFQSGCPIATTLLETAPRSEPITRAGLVAIGRWIEIVALVFERSGIDRTAAEDAARFTIAALEGALILARTTRSRKVIVDVGRVAAEAVARG
jgi:TetR/AcrR family transcriptional repressor of lmrAB and yxaGH operons